MHDGLIEESYWRQHHGWADNMIPTMHKYDQFLPNMHAFIYIVARLSLCVLARLLAHLLVHARCDNTN
jgi:hypothetical protein